MLVSLFLIDISVSKGRTFQKNKTDLNTQKPLDRSMDLKVTKGQVEKDPLPDLGKGLGT